MSDATSAVTNSEAEIPNAEPSPDEPELGGKEGTRSPNPNPSLRVRAADLEPYVGLRYLSRLFKLMAIIMILLLVSEIITGFVTSGLDALPTLLGEVSRLIVFAGLLWGSGDLAILFIDMGHDLRATRILIGRQLAHHMAQHHSSIDPAVAPASERDSGEPV